MIRELIMQSAMGMHSMGSFKPDAVKSLDIDGILSLAGDICQVLDTSRDLSALDEVLQEIGGIKSVVEKDHSDVQKILNVIEDEMDRLELERSRIESHKEAVNKAKKGEIRAQNELSLYASISRIIPDLSARDKYMGHIVDREKQKIKKFEFDRTEMSGVEICNRLWEMAHS